MTVRARCAVTLAISLLLTACPKSAPKSDPQTPKSMVGASVIAAISICARRTLQVSEGHVPTSLMPAPKVSPTSGIIGTRVTVTGDGVSPNSYVAIIGVFTDHNCEIEGVLGATNLAQTLADEAGRYASTFDWSPEFTSDLYPTASGVKSPAGRYQILVLQCADPTCAPPFAQGSLPSSLFLLASRLPAVPPNTPTCVKSQLLVRNDEPQSAGATGQHTPRFVIQNVGDGECVLFGYPRIVFDGSNGKPIPFVYRDAGDQMLTSSRPTRVGLAPKGSAYFAINKYRCDLGAKETATVTRITLPGEGTSFVLDGGPDYCGHGDPGSVIDISPLEPTALAEMSG